MDSGYHRLTGLDKQFIAVKAKAGLWINLRPSSEKFVQLLGRSGSYSPVCCLCPNISDTSVVDRSAGPREVG